MICTVNGCKKILIAKGFCTLHYQRYKKYNNPLINKQYKHKMCGTSEYVAWKDMKYRCYNKNNSSYKYYGARGIKVCDRWLESFDNFINDVGNKPNNKMSLDRINNNGDYEPSNVKWSTQSEQRLNSRSFGESGYKGICFNKRANSYQVSVWIDGKAKHIGYYKKLKDAIKARVEYIAL